MADIASQHPAQDPPHDPRFVHLRMHSEYSIVDGIVRIDGVVEAAAKDEQPALALTDLSNLFGLVRFYQAARAAGVKPIAGCDVWITGEGDGAHRVASRALLLAKNQQGYLALCELLSRGYLENAGSGRAELRFDWFAEVGTAGLIALSGAQAGDIGMALAGGRHAQAVEQAHRWARQFPGAFYIELQRYGQADAETYIDAAISLAGQLKLPVVATHPVQFLAREEFVAHEARTCISEGEMLANPRRVRRFTAEQYLKTQDEMAALFADIPSATINAVEIAKRCSLALQLGKPRLPRFPTPAGRTLDEHLLREAEIGLERRLAHLYPDEAAREAQRPRYASRLAFEATTISSMGFPGYFLIVADFINWAKNNGVPVGPGRGSGAGSLVAYSLGITDLDPLAYNLLFERFLNPERVSMPDFDIDFCQEGRDTVIDYVKKKYGADSVAQIATFGTMAAKAAIRDIGRVLDLPYNFVDGIAKLIPFKPGRLVTIADARKEEPLLAEREANEDEVREVLKLAEQVEGITRNVGMHAGGVLIAPGKLTDFTPLYAQPGSHDTANSVVSQYDKDDVESAGLVKFDFLGLTTLTILDWTTGHIRRLYEDQQDFTLEGIPLDDPKAYDLFRKAETVAVFQFESPGMRRMLLEAKPDRFGDIVALNALYRPGPMDLIPDFIARKKGERFEYPDPRVKVILEETYGIMVYQEQVMQMAQIIGGYSLGGADLLRRAMGKKKADEMATHRVIFGEGAQNNGVTRAKADEIFDLMEKFAGYGFNKAHAAAYSLLAVQTAWLKVHFTAEFMAANLSAAQDDTDKVKSLIDDARHHGLTMLAPDLNASEARFVPVRSSKGGARADAIRYGLCAIKGTGGAAIDAIVAARVAGPFSDVFDLCARVDKRLVNRRVIEALVRAGALDAITPEGRTGRASVFASIGRAMDAAEHAETHVNQVSLFGGLDEAAHRPEPVRVPAWTEKQALAEEKVALGFYFSGHLFKGYEAEVRRFARTSIASIVASREPQTVAGIVSACRTTMTRRGKMLIVTLDDASGQLEATVFNALFDSHRTRLREDELVILTGVVRNDDFSGGMRMVADSVLDLAMARSRYARGLRLSMNGASDAVRLRQLLSAYRASSKTTGEATPDPGCRITISYCTSHASPGARCEIDLGEGWRVIADDGLVGGLGEWLAPENVHFVYG
ncbi:MAG: DNA polymerase III subunit alpha [Burkholderiaceae bacterium]